MENMKKMLINVGHDYLYNIGITHDYNSMELIVSRDSIMNNKEYSMMSEDAAYQMLTKDMTARIAFVGEYRFHRVRHNDDYIFFDVIGKGL